LQRSGVLFGGLAGPGDGVVELVVVEVLDLSADEVLGEAGACTTMPGSALWVYSHAFAVAARASKSRARSPR
jgi:hypothetical protein